MPSVSSTTGGTASAVVSAVPLRLSTVVARGRRGVLDRAGDAVDRVGRGAGDPRRPAPARPSWPPRPRTRRAGCGTRPAAPSPGPAPARARPARRAARPPAVRRRCARSRAPPRWRCRGRARPALSARRRGRLRRGRLRRGRLGRGRGRRLGDGWPVGRVGAAGRRAARVPWRARGGLGRRGGRLGDAVADGLDRAGRGIESGHAHGRHRRALGERLGDLTRELFRREFASVLGVHQVPTSRSSRSRARPRDIANRHPLGAGATQFKGPRGGGASGVDAVMGPPHSLASRGSSELRTRNQRQPALLTSHAANLPPWRPPRARSR